MYICRQVNQSEMEHFALTIKPCPPGQALHITDSKDEWECRCNTDDQNIADCFPDEGKIILQVYQLHLPIYHIILRM